jgi:FkbM family methyltransferase
VVAPSAVDPPEISARLWEGVYGHRLGFDVGANCGQSIGEMRSRCQQVISFEPNPESYALASTMYPGVRIYQIAVSDHDGEVELAALGGVQEATGQFVTPGLHGMEWDPGNWDDVPRKTVPCQTLDSLAGELGVPDFIKVDTEGHEAKVVAGAAGLLARGERPRWLIEFHAPELRTECLAVLMDAGYRLETIRHPHYERGTLMWHQHGWLKTLPIP